MCTHSKGAKVSCACETCNGIEGWSSLPSLTTYTGTVKPLIKDTLKEEKPLNKGQTKRTFVLKLCTK